MQAQNMLAYRVLQVCSPPPKASAVGHSGGPARVTDTPGCRFMASWQKTLLSSLKDALESQEYVQRRSALLVLNKLIPVRPSWHIQLVPLTASSARCCSRCQPRLMHMEAVLQFACPVPCLLLPTSCSRAAVCPHRESAP